MWQRPSLVRWSAVIECALPALPPRLIAWLVPQELRLDPADGYTRTFSFSELQQHCAGAYPPEDDGGNLRSASWPLITYTFRFMPVRMVGVAESWTGAVVGFATS